MDGSYFLDRLWRPCKDRELPGGITVVIRALSDYEIRARNRQSLEASITASESLKDKASSDYKTHISPLGDASDDDLKSIILSARRQEARQELDRQIQPKYLPIPDGASDDEEKEVLKNRESEIEKVKSERETKEIALMKKYVDELDSKDHETLVKEASQKIIKLVSDAAYSEEYVYGTVLASTEDRDGKQFFSSKDEVRKLPNQVLEILMKDFREVNDLDPLKLSGRPVTDFSSG